MSGSLEQFHTRMENSSGAIGRDHSLGALRTLLAEPHELHHMQEGTRQQEAQWRGMESAKESQHRIEELTRSNAELLGFAHTTAHDLKEPLRTICAFTELLVRKAKLDEADQEIAGFIVNAASRMSSLLDQALASAAYGFKGSLRPVELQHVAALAMQDLKEALTLSGAKITINPLPTVQGNECDFVRLFQNLIANAVKYRSGAPLEVHIAAERLGPDWVVRFRDNGVGIKKDHHRRVFGLFTRLHTDEIPGTGIGLAVCKAIVERLGGTIWVESEPGAGSTFCFTIPAGQEAKPSPAH